MQPSKEARHEDEATAAGSGRGKRSVCHGMQLVNPDTTHSGGDVITVNDAQPGAEAFTIKDTKILTVGMLAGQVPG
jgi:hypothetical protein